MAITKEWLRQAATAKSYSKGEEYIDDVEDLVKQGHTYTAAVFGSEEYEVMIPIEQIMRPLPNVIVLTTMRAFASTLSLLL